MPLAHFNWAALLAPPGDPRVAGFIDNTGRVNAIAERSPGFIWRHGDEDSAARAIGWPLFTDSPTMIASFSVWEDRASFEKFVYKTVHGAFRKRGPEWFAPGSGVNYALWTVPEGHIPDIAEARDKVTRLIETGPCAAVFTLTAPVASEF